MACFSATRAISVQTVPVYSCPHPAHAPIWWWDRRHAVCACCISRAHEHPSSNRAPAVLWHSLHAAGWVIWKNGGLVWLL